MSDESNICIHHAELKLRTGSGEKNRIPSENQKGFLCSTLDAWFHFAPIII